MTTDIASNSIHQRRDGYQQMKRRPLEKYESIGLQLTSLVGSSTSQFSLYPDKKFGKLTPLLSTNQAQRHRLPNFNMHSEVLNSEEGPRKEMVNKRQNTYFHVLDTFKSPRPNHGYNLIPEQYSFQQSLNVKSGQSSQKSVLQAKTSNSKRFDQFRQLNFKEQNSPGFNTFRTTHNSKLQTLNSNAKQNVRLQRLSPLSNSATLTFNSPSNVLKSMRNRGWPTISPNSHFLNSKPQKGLLAQTKTKAFGNDKYQKVQLKSQSNISEEPSGISSGFGSRKISIGKQMIYKHEKQSYEEINEIGPLDNCESPSIGKRSTIRSPFANKDLESSFEDEVFHLSSTMWNMKKSSKNLVSQPNSSLIDTDQFLLAKSKDDKVKLLDSIEQSIKTKRPDVDLARVTNDYYTKGFSPMPNLNIELQWQRKKQKEQERIEEEKKKYQTQSEILIKEYLSKKVKNSIAKRFGMQKFNTLEENELYFQFKQDQDELKKPPKKVEEKKLSFIPDLDWSIKGRQFSMDKYSHEQISSAYQTFLRVCQQYRKGIKMYDEFLERQKDNEVQQQRLKNDFVKKIRSKKQFKDLFSKFQKEPVFAALVKGLAVFQKYQQKHASEEIKIFEEVIQKYNAQRKEDKDWEKSSSSDMESQDEGSESDATEFNELLVTSDNTIYLMKEIIQEISNLLPETQHEQQKQVSKKKSITRSFTSINRDDLNNISQIAAQNVINKIKDGKDKSELLSPFKPSHSRKLVRSTTSGKPMKSSEDVGLILNMEGFVQTESFQQTFQNIVKQLQQSYIKQTGLNQKVKEPTNYTSAYEQITKETFFKDAKKQVLNSGSASQDASSIYVNNCQKNYVAPTPLFAKIECGKLYLSGYYLNDELVEAFTQFIKDQNDEYSIISDLYLHNNKLSDTSFAQILTTCFDQGQLKSLTYSQNEFGPKSNEAIKKIFCLSSISALKNLTLINLKANQQVLKDLAANLEYASYLTRLVLKDLPLGQQAGESIVKFMESNQRLLDLQLINLSFSPQVLTAIAKEVSFMSSLQNFSLRKNVIRTHEENVKFIEYLELFIAQSNSLTHLDISAMFMGDKLMERLIENGVMQSQTLASVHFSDNKLSDQLKLKIHSCFIRSNGSASNKESEQFVHKVIELYQEGSDTESISKVSAKGSTENPKVNISIAALHDTSRLASGKSASSFENDGQADLLNKKEKILKNIYELNERGGIFLDEPKIQQLVNEDMKERKYMQDESNYGQLYIRFSNQPELYQEKHHTEELFKGAQWVCPAIREGCWICKSHFITSKELRHQQKGMKKQKHIFKFA